MMRGMGYSPEDAEELYRIISENAEREFVRGNYILYKLNEHGQVVNIPLALPGKGEKQDRIYRVKTGWMAYPNGKLHNNTPLVRIK